MNDTINKDRLRTIIRLLFPDAPPGVHEEMLVHSETLLRQMDLHNSDRIFAMLTVSLVAHNYILSMSQDIMSKDPKAKQRLRLVK